MINKLETTKKKVKYLNCIDFKLKVSISLLFDKYVSINGSSAVGKKFIKEFNAPENLRYVKSSIFKNLMKTEIVTNPNIEPKRVLPK